MLTLLQLPPGLPRSRACDVLGASRATLYRHLSPPTAPPEPHRPRTSPRKLPDAIRREVLEMLHSPRFLDQPPAEVYAELLSAGIYLCSIRTMYRLLHDLGESSERRSVRAPVRHAVPSLTATAVNQVWTWDSSGTATITTTRGWPCSPRPRCFSVAWRRWPQYASEPWTRRTARPRNASFEEPRACRCRQRR